MYSTIFPVDNLGPNYNITNSVLDITHHGINPKREN